MSDFTTNILTPPNLATPFSDSRQKQAFSYRQWCLFWFRVREWNYTFESNFDVSDPEDDDYGHSGSSSVVATLAPFIDTPTDEFDLIDPAVLFKGFTGTGGTYTLEDATTEVNATALQLGVEWELADPFFSTISYLSLITPSFAGAGSTTRTYSIPWTGDVYNTISAATSDSFTILDLNGTGKTLNGSFSLSITPSTFWGWGGKFNTLTGAPL